MSVTGAMMNRQGKRPGHPALTSASIVERVHKAEASKVKLSKEVDYLTTDKES
ncbi:hypothetical protein [Paraburkholderia rhizosphaerae]|uniref:Uncharacterized protein n=1 Tax=Paraburkholderia rhizosphaerae TaxID=480658 RepID=A0A4R8LK85_9BURK|nr:hypothetical protein [Paraburkholderia rhizosphaerae]TDY42750.1 hypothetical protein BX592_120114 [Paraburkholderia rhizosphaerae]